MDERMATYDGTVGQERQPPSGCTPGAPADAPVEPVSQALVAHPLTGEVLELSTASDLELAQFRFMLKEAEANLKEAKRAVTDEALSRMDHAVSWTLRAGPYRLRGASPEREEHFDALALRDALYGLVDEGVIAVEAADAAVEAVTDYKVRKIGINALRKLGGRVKETIDAHAFTTDKQRSVSVEEFGL